jgi:integrase
MTQFRLKYVHEFRDRHGKVRRYVRKPGTTKRVPLPGLPGSEEFMQAYQAALAAPATRADIGAARTKHGTVSFAIVAYYNSREFHELAESSQKARRRILEAFRVKFGGLRIDSLRRDHIQKILAEKPAFSARDWLKTLRAVLRFSVDTLHLREDDPTFDIKWKGPKREGYHSWTDDEIAQFEARHPVGTKPRLALALLLYTAQARCDVVKMGRQHVRDGILQTGRQKTGIKLEIPVHPELQRIIDATPSGGMTFLLTEYGRAFSAAGFGNWFRARCNEAGLSHCSAHGLRKAALTRLAEAGCSTHQIAAISGHKTLALVQHYTAAADRKKLAREAMRTLTGELEQPLANPLAVSQKQGAK